MKAEDGDLVRRLLGIALLPDGWPRRAAATASGMDRQTLCDWVHRYNADGAAGFAPVWALGVPDVERRRNGCVEGAGGQGPDPERDKRCALALR